MATPMPGASLERRSLLKELIPIEAVAGPSKDKGKSREEKEMGKGAIKKVQSSSLTISEYEGAFHNRDGAFIYNWIDDETGDCYCAGRVTPLFSFYQTSTWSHWCLQSTPIWILYKWPSPRTNQSHVART